MNEQSEIIASLRQLIEEEDCGGITCSSDDIFKDEEGWKLKLTGFMEPWYLGQTVEEAKASLQESASMKFGLG